MARHKALGRSLDSLLGPPRGPGKTATREVPLQHLEPNPRQPRKQFDKKKLEELALSIRTSGILQPLLVAPNPKKKDHFFIIAGERRWRAAQKAGLQEVPVLVRPAEEIEGLQWALVENLQRESLTPMEEARAYRALVDDFQMTQAQLAHAVGKSRPAVANSLRMLGLSQAAQSALEKGEITAGHARAILAQNGDPQAQGILLRGAQEGWSVRRCEKWKSQQKRKEIKTGVAGHVASADERRALDQLSRHLGSPVRLRRRSPGGDVIIAFANEDDLIRLVDLLGGYS